MPTRRHLVMLLAVCVVSPSSFAADAPKTTETPMPAALDFDNKTLDGKPVNLAEKYAGKVVLLVNVASKCGLTPQYEELQALHEKYAEQGLAVVGVPCNQFGRQEPGYAAEIMSFCEKNYGVEFDLLEKQNVKLGKPDQSPIYTYLTAEETGGEFAGEISWNFEKFLFSRSGEVVARFSPRVEPMSDEVVKAIESELAAE
ncbi:MAG: glutathione peroxidase [Planctomycetota bacterium]